MIAIRNMSRAIQNPNWITGILLVSSFLVLLLALVILLTSGAFPAFSAGLQGSLVEKAPFADTFRLTNLFWTVGWILQLMGFGLLTRLMMRTDGEFLAVLAFNAVLVATIAGILHGIFHMSVEIWAAQETARTGKIPETYVPLSVWIGSAFRIAYVLQLVGTVGFGWSLLRTGLLTHWVGWTTVGWGILWLSGYLVGMGVPGILFITPAVIGIAMLVELQDKPL